MAVDIKGEDVSISVTNAVGAPMFALSQGIQKFTASPELEVITSKHLEGVTKGQSFSGHKGSITLTQRDTRVQAFINSYIALLESGTEFRCTIVERIFDPSLRIRRTWTYLRCVLSFKAGDAERASALTMTIDWETGQRRIPG